MLSFSFLFYLLYGNCSNLVSETFALHFVFILDEFVSAKSWLFEEIMVHKLHGFLCFFFDSMSCWNFFLILFLNLFLFLYLFLNTKFALNKPFVCCTTRKRCFIFLTSSSATTIAFVLSVHVFIVLVEVLLLLLLFLTLDFFSSFFFVYYPTAQLNHTHL